MNEYGGWSSIMGYGLFCGKRCVAERKAAGIPPRGSKRLAKKTESDAEMVMATAALEAQRQGDKSWSPTAVTGVVVASLLGIALMVVIIKRAKRN